MGNTKAWKMGPCSNCPFRSDIRPYLRKGRIDEIQDSMVRKCESFVCHKTTKTTGNGTQQHCGGAMILMNNEGKQNTLMQIASRLGMWSPDEMKNQDKVFKTWNDMREAQD